MKQGIPTRTACKFRAAKEQMDTQKSKRNYAAYNIKITEPA
jgi:hypothetical protein